MGSYERNYGPKKSGMPSSEVCVLVLPLRIHCFEKGLTFRLQVLQVLPQAKPFGRFSKKVYREQGHSVKPATKAVYMPLIDINPAHPNSKRIAMTKAHHLTKEIRCR